MDDGSSDGSEKICDKFSTKYKQIKTIHKENGGVSSARNCGIENAKGNYIIFLDADDYIDHDFLVDASKTIEKHQADIFVYGYYAESEKMLREFLPIVDSGPTSSAGEFRNLLTSIIRSGETLDALIITHYDDDHIGGILKACDPGFTEIYFNAYAEATETENLSATQNQRLFHSLDRSKIHSSVLAGDEIAIDGARIIVHAPKPEMLSRAMAKMEEANAQLASVSDWTCSLDDLMAKPYPSSDTSIANQSSIVFTFEYAGIRNLFCGDAWAENIPGGKYDLVKLPHHGSIRNISDALLSRIQADTFLICADGTSHPNKQTIAKLLQQYGNISIYSNYSWWMNGFLMTDDMKYIKNGNLKLLII